jgi:hypothetical protein
MVACAIFLATAAPAQAQIVNTRADSFINSESQHKNEV